MTGKGLAEVANPSALFLGDRASTSPGTAVFAGIEGTRPLLVEIQALVAEAGYGTPRRAVVGWDAGRLAMILAVLDARGGLSVSAHDVYLNVAGGLKVGEPAADLAADQGLAHQPGLFLREALGLVDERQLFLFFVGERQYRTGPGVDLQEVEIAHRLVFDAVHHGGEVVEGLPLVFHQRVLLTLGA